MPLTGTHSQLILPKIAFNMLKLGVHRYWDGHGGDQEEKNNIDCAGTAEDGSKGWQI